MKILDLFCCQGGASMGLHQAFPDAEITGVDLYKQPHYPFTFIQADALDFDVDGYDFIWASPPCQAFSQMHSLPNRREHPNLIPQTRAKLIESNKPVCN